MSFTQKGFIVFDARSLIQHLFCTAAQVHLCHRITRPVISTNAAVRGAAGLFPTEVCSLAGSLVIPIPLLFSPPRPESAWYLAVTNSMAAHSRPGIANQVLFGSWTAKWLDFTEQCQSCQCCHAWNRRPTRQSSYTNPGTACMVKALLELLLMWQVAFL